MIDLLKRAWNKTKEWLAIIVVGTVLCVIYFLARLLFGRGDTDDTIIVRERSDRINEIESERDGALGGNPFRVRKQREKDGKEL